MRACPLNSQRNGRGNGDQHTYSDMSLLPVKSAIKLGSCLTYGHRPGGGAAHLHRDECVLHDTNQVVTNHLAKLVQTDPVQT